VREGGKGERGKGGGRKDHDAKSFGQLRVYNLLMLNREIFSLERMTKVNL
jgi:hypothetical protein